MPNISIPRDNNRITVLAGVSNGDGITPVTVYVDPITHRMLVNSTGGGAGVSSIASADGSIAVTGTTSVDLSVVKSPKWSTARLLAGNSVDGSGNVPFANKFIVQGTIDTGLSGAQFLGALATGILKNTTSTGVLSIAAAGTDYQSPITLTTAGSSGNATFSAGTLNIPNYTYILPTASTSVLGGVKVDGTSITITGGVISAVSGGSGTVTSVDTAASNNGITAVWATTTTTPRLTIGLADITPASVTVAGTTLGIKSTITGFNTTLAGEFVNNTSAASTPALVARNDTNFAFTSANGIARFQLLNATDTAPVLKLENAGSGNYITADSIFSVTIAGKVLSGSAASITDFTTAQGIFTQADSGDSSSNNVGLVGEAVASGAGKVARGVYGTAKTNGADASVGTYGASSVTASADTGIAYGVFGSATATHSGGINRGVFGQASGSTSENDGMAGTGSTSSAANGIGVLGTGGVGASADTGTSYGIFAQSTTTHAGGNNTAIFANASGGVNNYGLIVNTGKTGLNQASPTAILHLGTNGSSNNAPLKFTSGSVLVTTEAGTMEFNSGIFYLNGAASSLSVADTEQFISLSASAFTLTSTTAAQQLFNTSTNGALTVQASTTYQFECLFSLSAMSTTSGSFGFGFGGTATFTSQGWFADANKVGLTTATAPVRTYNTATNTTLILANGNTTGYAYIRGMMRINAAGTVIPQVSLGIAAAAVVGINSYFRLWAIGNNAVTRVGNWS